MDSETWARLSEWHNTWLDASPDDRERLQRAFVAEHPALEADVRDLVSAGPIAPGFLETFALALTLHELADDSAPLACGTRVGPYHVVALIASGGMGQVYRATDVRLGRDVAIKLLSRADRHDQDLVERFLQEARITAALDQPNIVRLFDVGIHDGRPFLVMELLEGETLRDRLQRSRLPPDETRRVTLDVAHGLTAAHAAGLVHRDLKPENLFLTRSGPVKILDFGVAKLVHGSPVAGNQPATIAGMLVGTAGYLAPEQILGETVDARADLFALGAILHEMLTGRRVFGREHTIDTLHAVLHEPAPALREEDGVASDTAAIVERLLEKDPRARFQSAVDLAWTLERTGGGAKAAPTPARSHRAPFRLTPKIAALAAAALLLATAWLRPWSSTASSMTPAPATPTVAHFTWRLPNEMRLGSAPVVSPDGRHIAFVGETGPRRELWIRDLASLDARAIPGTVDAGQPFWSPDSRSLGFFAKRKLLRVSLDSGEPPATLAAAPDPRGGTWSQAGTIVFQPEVRDSALMRVSASGGQMEPATRFDSKAGDISQRWPSFLPDGVHFLYLLNTDEESGRGIHVGSIADPVGPRGDRLLAAESGAMFVARAGSDEGTLLTVGSSHVEARPFDARALTFTGNSRTLALPAVDASSRFPALLDASADVLTVAQTPVWSGKRQVVMSMTGERLQVITGFGIAGFPRLSPDGRRFARTWVDPRRGNADLWVTDLDRGTHLRLTTGGNVVAPVWSTNGDRIAFRAGWNETKLAIMNADGTGTRTVFDCPRSPCEPTDWSRDGRVLLINAGADVWTFPVDPHQPPAPLLSTAFLERDARYSPDGRWIAYVSDESGRVEVSIRSAGGPPRRIVVSNQGGDQPVWQPDGAALFYVDHDHVLQRVSVLPGAEGGVRLGRPQRVRVPPFPLAHWGTTYDVSRSGTRIYLSQESEEVSREITIVTGWRGLLK